MAEPPRKPAPGGSPPRGPAGAPPRGPRSGDAPFVVQKSGGAYVVELLENSIVNRGELERVCEAIDRLIDAGPAPRLVIDFTQVMHLASVFLGKLIAFNKKIKAKGGELTLTNVSPRITEVFKLTKLDTQINIRQTAKPAPPSRAPWTALAAAAVASGILGLAAVVYLVVRGLPDRGKPAADRVAATALIYFALTLLLVPPVFLLRRWWIARPAAVQWTAAGAVIAVSLAMFAAFVLSR